MDLLVWSAYFFAVVFVINVELEAFNYAAVFGVCLGIYIIINLDVLVRSALTFVKGWRN